MLLRFVPFYCNFGLDAVVIRGMQTCDQVKKDPRVKDAALMMQWLKENKYL